MEHPDKTTAAYRMNRVRKLLVKVCSFDSIDTRFHKMAIALIAESSLFGNMDHALRLPTVPDMQGLVPPDPLVVS